MIRPRNFYILAFLFFTCSLTGQSLYTVEWSELSTLPTLQNGAEHPGLAGAFSGIHQDVLIIAGGANFPEERPWNGGKKVWWDEIFVLEKGEEAVVVHKQVSELPAPKAYGVSIPTTDGLICIGGDDSSSVTRSVFQLNWDPEKETISITDFPDLPRPLAYMAGALVGDIIYLIGGKESKESSATSNFWALDLSSEKLEWTELAPFPGPPRLLPLATAQSNGTTDCLFVFSGRNEQIGKPTEVLRDAYEYNPFTNSWKQLADIRPDGQGARSVMAGTCIASGANHILFFGGAKGDLFLQLEKLNQAITVEKDPLTLQRLVARRNELLNTHPGFSRDILAYHTITNAWAIVGELPVGSAVTTNAIQWGEHFVIPSGEIQPGVRTPKIWQATPKPDFSFGWVNFSIVGAYLLLLVAMGFYFSKRENSVDDYFKAGGRIPWWAAGLSIFGTQLSAITFMTIPAKTFASDWSYFMFNMGIIIVTPFIVFSFLPYFRRLNVTSAYEYLEDRFNLTARLFGSLMFMFLQLGRLGIVLFLPSMVLSIVTGVDVMTCIILMGVLSIIYTVIGGIEAVIWTDVIQVFVLVGGALISIVLILSHIDGGWSGLFELAQSSGKLKTFDFQFDFTRPTFWVVLLGGISASLISYGSDQSVVQRYMTTKDEKSAAKSIWTNALLSVPTTLIFFTIGTALFVLYQNMPEQLDPYALKNTDAIFPFFIVTQLPTGVAGLLIAGVFSAAMSSLDSSMNSVASAVTTDFYRRFRPNKNDREYLNFARWATAIVGISGTALALMMAGWNIKSLWDQFNTFIGLFAGGLGGLFILGMFTKRANGKGAVIGLLASAIVQYYVKTQTEVFLLLYTFSGLISCFGIGYLASFLFPAPMPKSSTES